MTKSIKYTHMFPPKKEHGHVDDKNNPFSSCQSILKAFVSYFLNLGFIKLGLYVIFYFLPICA